MDTKRALGILSAVSFCLQSTLASPAAAEDGRAVITEPAEAETDADYRVQGEYAGTVTSEGQEIKVGAQVLAMGGGKFEALGYEGGLPGDGWDPATELHRFRGERKGETTVLAEEPDASVVLTIRDGVMSVAVDGAPCGSIKRVVRESKTLGKKPPEGAVVLFDGKSVEGFSRGDPRWEPERYQEAVMTEDGLLMVGRPNGGHVFSKRKFQSATVHLEFRTAYMPRERGHGRSNSGCYLQGRYEVQVLDSFGLPLEKIQTGDCGGIYSVSKPRVNMCYPPLAWQTLDIEYTAGRFDEAGKKIANPRMTVRHNGVLIHEDVEIDRPGGTTAAPYGDSPEPGALYLQDHGCPLRYRNIWVVPR